MSEEKNDGQQAGGEQQQTEFKPITSQEEFEKALGKRLERERAKFADYDDLRTKAQKFDEVQEQNKTELQKAQERAEQAEKRAAANERRVTQTQIAAEFGVPLEAIHGDDEAAMRESAERLVAWRDSNKPKPPETKKLKSGAAGSGDTSGSRAAAALRQMRGAGN